MPRGKVASLTELIQMGEPPGSRGWRMVQAKAGPRMRGEERVRLLANCRMTLVVLE